MAPSVEHLTLDFGSGHHPRVMGLSPTSDSTLSLLKVLSLPLSAHPPCSYGLSLSLSFFLKKKKYPWNQHLWAGWDALEREVEL